MTTLRIISKWVYSKNLSTRVTKVVISVEENTSLTIEQESKIKEFFKTL